MCAFWPSSALDSLTCGEGLGSSQHAGEIQEKQLSWFHKLGAASQPPLYRRKEIDSIGGETLREQNNSKADSDSPSKNIPPASCESQNSSLPYAFLFFPSLKQMLSGGSANEAVNHGTSHSHFPESENQMNEAGLETNGSRSNSS